MTLKRLLPAIIICGILVIGGGVFFLTRYLATRYITTRSSQTAVCFGMHAKHHVVIQDNTMNPKNTEASLCDTLTITNADDEHRIVAFGQHNHHKVYDNVIEKGLKKGQSFTITLNQAGTYTFHDHLHDEVQGKFTVSEAVQ